MRESLADLDRWRVTAGEFASPSGATWGLFRIRDPKKPNRTLKVLSSGEAKGNPHAQGWEHVSVSRSDRRLPSWEDMAYVKSLFWSEEETVVQFHPRRAEYKNLHPGVLHMWKHEDGHPLPDSALV